MSNMIWTVIVVVGIAVAAYFLLPSIGGWISDSMGKRDTMDRPSSVDVQGQLPNR